MNLQRFNPQTIVDAEMGALYAFSGQIRAEQSPHDPRLSYEQFAANIRSPHPLGDSLHWAMWDGDTVVARGNLGIPRLAGNEHLVQFEILVLPEWRRQGTGTSLLRVIAEHTRAEGRTLLLSATYSTIPAGAAFLSRIGAEAALEGRESELILAEVDRTLIRTWIERAGERASGFELGFWEGSYPEDRLEEIAAMMDAINTVPQGDLEVEDFHHSVENVRAMDAMNRDRGLTRITCYVQEKDTRHIAGFTEVIITDSQPAKAAQELTAVFPDYRNKGLGRWIKAAMVEKLLTERRDVERLGTGNAHTNEPMLNINTAMGFRPIASHTLWQVAIDTVDRYLASR